MTISDVETWLECGFVSAVRIYNLIIGAIDPFTYDIADKEYLSEAEAIMEAINIEVRGYGIEWVRDNTDTTIIEYVDMGQTYAHTVVRRLDKGDTLFGNRMYLGTWGDAYAEWERENQ